MKTETKEIITKTKKEVFVAEDGTEFEAREECVKYESSAEFAVKLRLVQKGVLKELPTAYKEKTTGALYFGLENIFGCCEDYTFYLFCPETEEDVKAFTQFAKLILSESCVDTDYQYTKEKFENLSERLLTDDSDKWESYRQFVNFSELKPGKKYIFRELDGWGHACETEQLKDCVKNIVDAIVEQFAKK